MRYSFRRLIAASPVALVILALSVSAGTQVCAAQNSASSPLKYWIFFSDKADPSLPLGKTQPVRVSSKAVDRRNLRGNRPAEWLDREVSGEYQAALDAAGVEIIARSRWLNAVSARLSMHELSVVRRLDFVRDIRPVARRRSHLGELNSDLALPPALTPHRADVIPTSRSTRLDYGSSESQLAIVNAIPAIERGIDGSGVRIGFLDTEYADLQHAAFETLRNEGRLIASRNFTDAPQENGVWWHGFAVASVAVGFSEGNLIGPAHGAEVLLATTEYVPSETPQEEDFFVEGLEWLEASGADVVNCSLGYFDFDGEENDYSYADLDGDTGVTTIAADIAASLGVVFVASAGNSGACGNPIDCMYYIATPADGDSVITVGGVAPDGSRYIASSYGPTADGRIKPDVVAQASGVFMAHPSDNSAYITSGGTSFSSPMVAAIAAQMLQVNPELGPIEVRDILRMTSSQANSPDNSMGWGTVDADAAIMMAESLPGVVAKPLQPDLPHIETYPTPFSTSIHFVIENPRYINRARILLYDMLGREIDVAHDGPLNTGINRIGVETGALPPGAYVYSLATDWGTTFGPLIKSAR